MGTSTPNPGPSGPGWTTLKTRATRFAKSPGAGTGVATVAGIMSALVDALGGPRQAATGSPAGRAAAARVASVASGLVRVGPAGTLEELGLGELVGQSPSAVLAALVDLVAGEGNSVEAAAARQAAAEVLGQLVSEVEAWDELEAGGVEVTAVAAFLERFLAQYVFQRVMAVIAQRIEQNADPKEAAAKEAAIRDFVEGHVRFELSEVDAVAIDWDGPQGRALIDTLFESAFGAFWPDPGEGP